MSEDKKFIFHVHTTHSLDGRISPKRLVEHCRRKNIDIIAVCDHNSIDGALEAAEIAKGNPIIIIGEEIGTKQGEIIGLFLSNKIEKGLEAKEAISMIRQQNSLVCLPHPGESLRRSAIKRKVAEELAREVDIIEVYNSRTTFCRDIRWAENLAARYQKPVIFGADAHNIRELEGAIAQIKSFNGSSEFLNSLMRIKLISKRHTGIALQSVSIFTKWFRKLLYKKR